ncbi:hypothetical protein BOTBODRAFT_53844 [Botryobasidium botryosum FD-172 SS1]|uniref:Uncharacterized protein n=1 Tax=Botryobasidium botryosum (strain FD-172 SS1) TaxID=930990 RepID=A0A067MMI8_BOTB1|nr:hypothetical protein BOTBODRAFT_53844 [Botryobasidium botryosum FD-172 SS1]
MGNGQSGPKITAQDRAILDLKLQRDKIRQYQKKITIVLDREHAIAKESLASGNKARALTALRRRKYQEGLLSKTDGQLEALENLVSTIEFSLVEKDVLFGLKQGNSVLKELHSEMSLESVEKLMGETADAIAYQREIDEALMSKMTHEEEESVQQELLQLQTEALGLPSVPQTATEPDTIALPSAPSTEPVSEVPQAVSQTETRIALEA